ncbi:NmrA family NAD(P)-binding protein [Nocardia sp. NBC_01009]|uniref:NmrA family NAD(P)-binding protein n=1 Tax=Nocardia sp. NBC_01009 TaxID=2975996 RepID=UPI00386BF130|nr:NmrA family NAD(P)-binding protein [Nocardia sp. NBC_01009]
MTDGNIPSIRCSDWELKGLSMTNQRVLVTGATGRVGSVVATQLLERGVATRVMVHRSDARSARLAAMGAEIVIADMFDFMQIRAAMDGVDRLYFNAPYHPHVLDSAVAFAVAARRAGVQAIVAMGQWLASPEHPSLMTRQMWFNDKLFELLPDTAHIAIDPGFFADNYLIGMMPVAAQFGILPMPTGAGRNAPPSNEDIARVVVGALLDPHRHEGKAYRPTGPRLLSGADIADAMGEALGRPVRHVDVPPKVFMKAVRANARRLRTDMFFESCLRNYLPETPLGTWEVGGPTTHVRDVAGVEPEDFLTIARRYAAAPECRRTAGNFVRSLAGAIRIAMVPMHRLDKFDHMQQHPQPAHPRFSGESAFWQHEHPAAEDRLDEPLAATDTDSARV